MNRTEKKTLWHNLARKLLFICTFSYNEKSFEISEKYIALRNYKSIILTILSGNFVQSADEESWNLEYFFLNFL